MLVTVKTQKFTLGRNIYLRGDVFECREAEARLLIASSLVVATPLGVKATRGQPTPPIGLSIKLDPPAPEVEQQKTIEPVKTLNIEPKPIAQNQDEEPLLPSLRRRRSNPVGAMMQPESTTGAKPKA